MACSRSSSGMSPTVTTSTGTLNCISAEAAAFSMAPATVSPASGSLPAQPGSQGVGPGEEDGDAAGEEQHPGEDPEPSDPAPHRHVDQGCRRLLPHAAPPGPLALIAPQPDHPEAQCREPDGPGERVAEPEA